MCLFCVVLLFSRSVISDSAIPWNCNPLDRSVHEILQARITGVGCHFLLQGIFPTQGSNLGLLHCRWILYQLSQQGSLFLPLLMVKAKALEKETERVKGKLKGCLNEVSRKERRPWHACSSHVWSSLLAWTASRDSALPASCSSCNTRTHSVLPFVTYPPHQS